MDSSKREEITRVGLSAADTRNGCKNDFAPGEVLVGMKNGVKTKTAAELCPGLKVIEMEDLYQSVRKALPKGKNNAEPARTVYLVKLALETKESVWDAIEILKKNPDVAYAEPNYILDPAVVPDDPRFGDLWGMEKIQAPKAWVNSVGDWSVKVGVLDTGFDFTHPDLAANLDRSNAYYVAKNSFGFDADIMDYDGHGTHVAGIVGAVGNNGVGVVGVNWNVTIIPIKLSISNSIPQTYVSYMAKGILYASELGLPVINMSYQVYSCGQTLVEAAAAYDGLFTICAGNHNRNLDDYGDISFSDLNNLGNVIFVAASDRNNIKCSFSNFGKNVVALAAPGTGILSTYRSGGYASAEGTSMAAPHAAGAAALLLSCAPHLTTAQLKALLLNSADIVPELRDFVSNGRRLNVYKALTQLPAQPPPVFVSPPILNLPAAAYSASVTVSPINGWNVSSDVPLWLTFSLRSKADMLRGIYRLTVTANKGRTGRSGTLTFEREGHVRRVAVTQARPELEVSPAVWVPQSAGITSQAIVTVTSTVAWTAASGAKWLAVSPVSGLCDGNIRIVAEANPSKMARTGTITVNGSAAGLRTVTVVQGAAALVASADEWSPLPEGSSLNVAVYSNVNWTVGSDAASWLTVSPEGGSLNGSFTVTAQPNNGPGGRTGNVVITGGDRKTITVKQDEARLAVEPARLDPPVDGDTMNVTVKSNVNWTVSKDSWWLTTSVYGGMGDGSLTISAQWNGEGRRTGTVTIAGGGVAETITVAQAGNNTLYIYPAEWVAKSGGASRTTLNVYSTVEWTVSSKERWLTFSLDSGSDYGSFTIEAAANNTRNPRIGEVIVEGGGLSQTATVMQAAATTAIELELDTPVTVKIASGGRQEVCFTAPEDGHYMIKSSHTNMRVSPYPMPYVFVTGPDSHNISCEEYSSYQFWLYLAAGEIFTYYTGVSDDLNVNVTYTVTVTRHYA